MDVCAVDRNVHRQARHTHAANVINPHVLIHIRIYSTNTSRTILRRNPFISISKDGGACRSGLAFSHGLRTRVRQADTKRAQLGVNDV